MNPSNLTAYFKEHFSARIFVTFTMLIIGISLAFTVFFFRYQSRSLADQTVSKGELLTRLFAQTARLGVFTENTGQLSVPIDGILENREVLSVAVYTAEGKILALKNRPGDGLSPGDAAHADAVLARMLIESTPAVHFMENGTFVFFSRLALRVQDSQDDAIYADAASSQGNEQVLGFVRLILDGRLLQKSLQALLFDSILIGLTFLIIGSVVAYYIVGKVTKPLNRLTEGVNALGMGEELRGIVVETGDEIGNLATAFNTMVDSLKKREAEKLELAEQLRHSQKMEAIGTLAGGMAHDFNNILTVISGYGELLKNRLEEGGKPWSYADQIENAVGKAASLTQRLLAFSRNQIIHPKPLKLNHVITNLEKILALLVTEDIELQFDLDPADPTVMADSGQLDHVLINLVTNARDAMPRGGRIIIKTGEVTLEENSPRLHAQENAGNYAVVTVSDNGIGMTEQIKERIFDPFYSTKEVGKGTGLGLSMAYGIVQNHHGLIEVETEPGKGTSLSIYLPMIEQVTEKQNKEAPQLPQGNSEIILLAEDDMAIMGLLKGMLEANGYVVIVANNGEEAVLKFIDHQDSIKLALLDVIMPRKNGKEVRDEIMAIRPEVKTLFMSGYTSDVISGQGHLEEGIQLISKPLRINDLLLKIKEILEG
jgi:signal transduction histidine kinase/CheY-like chemotaxis protein